MEPTTDLSFSAWDFDDKNTTTTKTSASLSGEDAKEEVVEENGEEAKQELREVLARLWQKRGKAWRKRFLIGSCLPQGTKPRGASDRHLANQPWVFATKSGCGCLPCSEAKTGTEWSISRAGLVPKFRVWFLEKHQASKQHVEAVKMMLGLEQGSLGAPPVVEFERMLEKLRAGSSLRSALIAMLQNCFPLRLWGSRWAVL